ncbi:ureidoglycolate lyase [Hydrogenophaga sp.]|jgi:ureidoglycolate lyase|uniref:ureidoglycolate lyase n=1 Tax=Hydrogenophaga sp. TaxID=1904254 RepID=UPI00262140B1|nr:ureidoglycolate lyase [Hydrogenophaga sp.]MDM7950993.1 ureidoglycolate lyase [Hydrogenophaga sp.]
MTMTLKTRALSGKDFAPYGQVLDWGQAPGQVINSGTSVRIELPSALTLGLSPDGAKLAVFRAHAQAPRGPWRTLERHRLGSQTFVPMNGARFIALVALGEATPDPNSLAAFQVEGHQGITLSPGTWHHALLALDAGDFFVIERGQAHVDCEVVELARPILLA